MEKISGEDLVEMTNAVNELIDRLKTLEDKVKFIMENTDKEIFNQTSMQEADSKWVTLQDLWDEKDEVDMSSSTSVLPENHTFTDGGNSLCPHGFPYKSAASYCSCKEPTVNISDKNTKEVINVINKELGKEPTDKSEKIEEIISDFCRLGIKLDLEIEDGYIIKNWLRDKLKSL